MKWGSGKDSFVDSARFTKWRGTRYVYIYIYTEEKGKSWGVEANDINYSQSPGLKYPKNSRICSWTEAALVGPDTKCLCLNKGFYPSLPLRLWQIRLRVRDPSTLLLFLFSLSLSPFALIALFEIFTPLICVHDGNRGREGGRANPRDYFSFVIENKLRFLMSVPDGCFYYISIVIFIVGWIDRALDTIRKKRSMGQEVYIVQVKLPGVLILWDVRGSVTNYKDIISYVVSWITRLFRLILRIFVWRFITFREVSHICSSKYSI